jgi:hypothetical protein
LNQTWSTHILSTFLCVAPINVTVKCLVSLFITILSSF